jgi:hypothetical protein
MKNLLTLLLLTFCLIKISFLNASDPNANRVHSYPNRETRSWTLYDTSNSPLPSNTINCIALDQGTNKWLGTDNGLVKFDGFTWTVYNTENSGITGNNVTEITVDIDNLKWIYTTDGGLIVFDDNQWITHGTVTGVYTLKADDLGNIWAGKSSILSEFSHGGWLHYTTTNSGVPNSNINAIEFDFLNYKWLGTESAGLVRFDGANWIAYSQSNTGQPINSILSLYYDMQNHLWIGTANHAVVMFDAINWTSYQASNSPFSNDSSISCISQGNIQAVWFGTTTEGLVKKSGAQWTVYALSDTTFPTNSIKSLAVDNLDVKWVGTPIGLVKLDNLVSIGPGEPGVSLPDPELQLTCYPNPFNPTTRLKFELINSQHVLLSIYNLKGQLIQNLVDEDKNPGNYQISWNGIDKDGQSVASGLYLCNLKVGMKQVTKKILLIK